MKIAVIGSGYVGLVTGTCLAETGNELLFVLLSLSLNMIKFLTPFFFFLSLGITAQNIKDSCISAPVFSFSYGHQFPFGDLQNRFGSNNNVGFSGGYKLKSNWLFEFSTDFIFGTNVKDTTIVDHLQNNQNWIINQLGEEGIILIQQRGQVFSFKSGLTRKKLFRSEKTLFNHM